MVLGKRKNIFGREENILCLWVSNIFRVIGVILVLVGSAICVSFLLLLEKVWTRGGRADQNEFCLVKIVKSICAFGIITLIGIFLLIVGSLSFIYKKLMNGKIDSEREERQLLLILFSSLVMLIEPIVNFFSKIYEFFWSLWDMLDKK